MANLAPYLACGMISIGLERGDHRPSRSTGLLLKLLQPSLSRPRYSVIEEIDRPDARQEICRKFRPCLSVDRCICKLPPGPAFSISRRRPPFIYRLVSQIAICTQLGEIDVLSFEDFVARYSLFFRQGTKPTDEACSVERDQEVDMKEK